MTARSISSVQIRRLSRERDQSVVEDRLATEEPLEIRLGFPDGKHRAISITMRTPGDDAELAAGFLFTEGIIKTPEQIKQIRHCGLKIGKANGTLDRAAALNSNTIRVDLNEDSLVDLKKLERHFYTTSSCGVCGKSSIEALKTTAERLPDSDLVVSSDVIGSLPDSLRAVQGIFEQTGGLHASALFGRNGDLDLVREDVGRHNALDKVIGRKFLDGELPLTDNILLVSGRASFELVQKAAMAGISVFAAVGAPSSLAVELAGEFNITLLGFVRDGSFNIYTGEKRVLAMHENAAGL